MKRKALRLARVVILLILLAAAAYALLLAHYTRALRNLRAEMAAEGHPLTAAEIIPPAVPDGENAAPLYESAYKLLEAINAGEGNMLGHLGEQSARFGRNELSLEEKEQFLRDMGRPEIGEALNLLARATERTACRFPVRWDQGAAMLLPHVGQMRQLTRILVARSRIELAQGDAAAAWAWMHRALRSAEALRDEPIIISQLVRIAQTTAVLEALHPLVALAPPGAEDAAALAAHLAALDDRVPFVASLDGERILLGDWGFTASLHELAGGIWVDAGSSSQFHPRLLRAQLMYSKPVRLLDYAAYLRQMRHATRRMNEPYHVSPDFQDEEPPRMAYLTRMMLPALGGYRKRCEEHIAQVRTARAGLALERHRVRHGAYPETLDALVPALLDAVPEDPFSGRPLVYRREGDGYRLYSVGPDGRDNDGAPRPRSGRRGEEYDILWTPTIPPPAAQ